MAFHVWITDDNGRRVRSRKCNADWPTLDAALSRIAAQGDHDRIYEVLEDGFTVWKGYPREAKEGLRMTDLLDQGGTASLNIPREDLIAALQAKVDEATAKREAEQAKLDEQRKEAIEAIGAFSAQELYQIFQANFTVVAEDLKRYKEEERYVPKPIAATPVESDLERAVRVLTLAGDKTVEVRPNTDLYRLL